MGGEDLYERVIVYGKEFIIDLRAVTNALLKPSGVK